MAINIKNQRAVDSVKRLAKRRGVSYTAAIEFAVDAALDQPDQTAQQAALDRVQKIAADYRAHLPSDVTIEVDQFYDNDGLYL